jgi:hypothetical protein
MRRIQTNSTGEMLKTDVEQMENSDQVIIRKGSSANALCTGRLTLQSSHLNEIKVNLPVIAPFTLILTTSLTEG